MALARRDLGWRMAGCRAGDNVIVGQKPSPVVQGRSQPAAVPRLALPHLLGLDLATTDGYAQRGSGDEQEDSDADECPESGAGYW